MNLLIISLLQIDGSILKSVNNLYSLIGLVILSVVYIITVIYNKNQDKNQQKKIIESFEEQNDKIIIKIDELKDQKNILDEQSSIDVITSLLVKSMLEITKGVKNIIETELIIEQKSMYISKKSMVFEKIKNLVDTQIRDNTIVMGRIYHNNIKLSHYISELDTNDLITEITHKIFSLTDKTDSTEVTEYIHNRFSQFIQLIELQLSK